MKSKNRKDTLKRGDASILFQRKNRYNSLWSKLDDNTQNDSLNIIQQSQYIESQQESKESKNNISKKRVHTTGDIQQLTEKSIQINKSKKRNSSNLKKKGLQEYEMQKNYKEFSQNITSIINRSFDENNINDSILEKEQEQKQILKAGNIFPHILQSLRNSQNSNIFDFNKSEANSMAECSQENLNSSRHMGEISPGANYLKNPDQIIIQQTHLISPISNRKQTCPTLSGQKISPIKLNTRIRGYKSNNLKKNQQTIKLYSKNYTNSSSVDMGGGYSFDMLSGKNYEPQGSAFYYGNTTSNKNESCDETQENSILLNSQILKNISPKRHSVQDISFESQKPQSQQNVKKQIIQSSCTQQVDDIYARRQKNKYHINKTRLPTTLPIMTSQSVQQTQQNSRKASLNQINQQLPNINKQNSIEVKQYRFGERVPLQETINIQDTINKVKQYEDIDDDEYQQKLNKRQKIIDSVNSSFMPRYIHINCGKLTAKTNPKMIRSLLTTYKKEDLYKRLYVLQNYKHFKNRDESDYYGITELTVPPKEHKFITSTIQHTYQDIKTDKILA